MSELPKEAAEAAARASWAESFPHEPWPGPGDPIVDADLRDVEPLLQAAAPAIRHQRDEEWEAIVKGKKGERWFVSVTKDHQIDRSWPASCEDGETPQERLMGAGVKIVAVIPEAVLRERDEELREKIEPVLRAVNGLNTEALLSLGLRQRQITAAIAIFEEADDA